ncbi:trypco2 family protein [Kitasatospora purpeofusca]|uniref:trypco2 family protein n=1 Tax=Kitasatospora purpeofusca TaxID=67352 RepID=UPI003802526A
MELSDMVRESRQQLTTAPADGRDEAVRFGLGPVELEATVAAGRVGGADVERDSWEGVSGAAVFSGGHRSTATTLS